MARIVDVYVNRRMGPMLLLGLGSGLAYTLCTDTLQAWLTDQGLTLKDLGVAAVIALPFSLKFLWAPLMDRYVPPLLGRRRGWLAITQVALALLTLMLAASGEGPKWQLGLLALMLAFMGASQDIVGDAYRTDRLEEKERGAGAAVWVMGWRGGYAMSGIAAFILVGKGWMSWATAYQVMAALMVIPLLGTLWAEEPPAAPQAPATLAQTFTEPLRDFALSPRSLLVILFILLFKAPDFMAGQMTIPFLRRGADYSPEVIGSVRQAMGVAVMVIGTFVGGAMCARLSLRTSLWTCAVLQGVSNLAFIPLLYAAGSVSALVATISVENFIAGMSNAVFVAFLTGHCSLRFSATQYALLSGVMALSRLGFGLPSGWIAEQAGWSLFFFISMLTMLPGLLMLPWVPLQRPPEEPPRGFAVIASPGSHSNTQANRTPD